MKNPISIFIMDVSNSSSSENEEELSQYLDELVEWITDWTDGVVPIKLKHRSGDEIIFAGEGYSTAYNIAFYIRSVWKYPSQAPYFGFSFGDIDKEIAEIDIEKWIHPLVKQARYSNELLKKEQVNRPQFKYELDQFYAENQSDSFPYHEFRFEFETLLNSLLRHQQQYIRKQTELQKLVCSLHLIYEQQKIVAKLLGRTAPTISSHYKKGHCEEILAIFNEIVRVLNSLQNKAYSDQENEAFEKTKMLEDTIRTHLKKHIRI